MHYVYQYKTLNGKVKYIGRGENASRAVKHISSSHNKKLENWIAKGKYKLEIAGPFNNRETAIAVESALISSINPDYNSRNEATKYIFRPLGVPERYAGRLQKPALKTGELFKKNTQTILLVKISDKDIDHRVGYDLVNPPTEPQIVERVCQYWQLGRHEHLGTWQSNPSLAPTLVLGVTGKPKNQLIIASMEIDSKAWEGVNVSKGNKITLPLKDDTKLDKYSLRGRYIHESVGIKFGRFTQDFFRLIRKVE